MTICGKAFGQAVAIAAVLLSSALATAAEGPWYAGTTPERREQARAAFTEGTELLKDAFFTRAIDKLRAALALWDHPATHFNLAKALMNLDQPAEAVRHLWAAMRHGGAPLSPEQVTQLERYAEMLVGGELTHLVVRSERGGPVTLGARALFEGPGRWEGRVPPGALSRAAGDARVAIDAAAGRRVEVVIPRAGAPTHAARAQTADDVAALQRHMLGFVVRFPTAAERAALAKPAPEPLWQDPGDGLPAPSARLCTNARGDLLTVCKQYEIDRALMLQLRRNAAKAQREALDKLRAMTGGGIVELLE
ncbi:MAG: hypothetical protein IT385_15115 [Deltaproteobacteria bacterium]|nr:hypothetical protein [Deltaproteobacteria bacterium]